MDLHNLFVIALSTTAWFNLEILTLRRSVWLLSASRHGVPTGSPSAARGQVKRKPFAAHRLTSIHKWSFDTNLSENGWNQAIRGLLAVAGGFLGRTPASRSSGAPQSNEHFWAVAPWLCRPPFNGDATGRATNFLSLRGVGTQIDWKLLGNTWHLRKTPEIKG